MACVKGTGRAGKKLDQRGVSTVQRAQLSSRSELGSFWAGQGEGIIHVFPASLRCSAVSGPGRETAGRRIRKEAGCEIQKIATEAAARRAWTWTDWRGI